MKVLPFIIGATVAIILVATFAPIYENPTNKEELDVFVIAGQSNTYPWVYLDPTTADPIPEAGHGFYFGTTSNPTYSKSFDLDACDMYDINNEGSARIGGLFPSFAAAYYEKTHRDVYLIDTGISGVSITTYLPGGENYDWPGEVITAALSHVPSSYQVNLMGYVWIQGETDGPEPVQTYEMQMLQLYEEYNSNYPVKLPTCYICKVKAGIGKNAAIAQEWLAENYEQFVMASTLPDTFTVDNGLMASDNIHYSQAGFNALGVDLVDHIPAPAEAPDYSSLYMVIIPIFIAGIIMAAVAMLYKSRD